MPFVQSAEIWVPEREQFVFTFHVPASGDLWTFVVSKKVLEELCGRSLDDPEMEFTQFRSQIYLAAQHRMGWADPTRQQSIEAEEIKAAEGEP